MKYATLIPLLGGMTLGHMKSTGEDPRFLISYDEFKANDKHLTNYFEKKNKDVPYISLSNNTTFRNEHRFYSMLDMVSVVPPCAALSTLNNQSHNQEQSGPNATSTKWIRESVTLLTETIKPQVVMIENAPALLTNRGYPLYLELINEGEKNGYSSVGYKTYNYFHGTHQRRKRAFLFLFKEKFPPIIPFSYIETKNVKDDIKLANHNSIEHKIFTHKDLLTDNLIFKFFKLKNINIHEENGYTLDRLIKLHLLDELLDFAIKEKDKFHIRKLEFVKSKLKDNKGYYDVSPFSFIDTYPTINSKSLWSAIHTEEDRYLTVREFMHAMCLPDDFDLNPSGKDGTYKGADFNHIAQNISVNTSAWFTNEIQNYLNNELIMSKEKHILIDNLSKEIQSIKKTTTRKLF